MFHDIATFHFLIPHPKDNDSDPEIRFASVTFTPSFMADVGKVLPGTGTGSMAASISLTSSNINKGGFLGGGGIAIHTDTRESNTVSAQLGGLFNKVHADNKNIEVNDVVGNEVNDVFGSEVNDVVGNIDKINKDKGVSKAERSKTNTAISSETPAAKKTKVAQSIGQSMKSMLTGGRNKARAAPAPPTPLSPVPPAQNADIVPDDPMNDA